jgi:hypothetical protein
MTVKFTKFMVGVFLLVCSVCASATEQAEAYFSSKLPACEDGSGGYNQSCLEYINYRSIWYVHQLIQLSSSERLLYEKMQVEIRKLEEEIRQLEAEERAAKTKPRK